ncbi:MAG: hypothetical protein JWP89_273 [Schlesneria sp.]|nr:hypothetical protein [Schlesneria sp.]
MPSPNKIWDGNDDCFVEAIADHRGRAGAVAMAGCFLLWLRARPDVFNF